MNRHVRLRAICRGARSHTVRRTGRAHRAPIVLLGEKANRTPELQRGRKARPPKAAIVAATRKLLTILIAISLDSKPWQPFDPRDSH